MKISKILLILFLHCFFAKAQSEKNVIQQSLLWTRYNNQLEFNKNWLIQTDLDNRVFIKPGAQNLFLARVQLRHKWNYKVDAAVGFTYAQVATQDLDLIKPFHVAEYRGQQDVNVKQPLGKFILSHRYQMEERWVQNTSQFQVEEGTSFSLRFRYRVQLDYTILKRDVHHLKAMLNDEILINVGDKIVKNSFDQNRIYAALQFGVSPSSAVELGYMNSFQQRSNGVDYYNRDIIRFSFIHKLKL